MIAATLNEQLPLEVLLSDGRTDLYAQVRLYTAGGGLLATINLTHSNEGLYTANWTPTSEGWFTAVFQFYFDAGRTIDAGYEKQGEQIEVTQNKTNILRLLGRLHHNAVIDQQAYDVDGNCISARVRAYDTATNAQAAGVTGLRFTWLMTSTYTSGVLTQFLLKEI